MVQSLFEPEDENNNAQPRGVRPGVSLSAASSKLKATGARRPWLDDFSRSSSDFGWSCDASLCLTHISDGFTRLSGILTREILNQPLETLFDPEERKETATLLAMLARGNTVAGEYMQLRTRTRARPILLDAVPVKSVDGRLIGFEGTARALAEHETQPYGKSEDDDVASIQFAHAIQHELRTPLNAIVGFAEIMREDLNDREDGRYAAYCDDIISASKHLLGLIEDMVGAHIAGSQTNMPLTAEVDLTVLVEEVARLLEPLAHEAGLTLDMTSDTKPLMCVTDRRRLKQIIVNLLENAVKFTPSGKSVGMALTSNEHHSICIDIWDEGPGIDAADQEAIWRRFSKSGSQSRFTSSSPGLGLGLSVAKSLADAIGAVIALDSQPGEGSHFKVMLPKVIETD